jgi:hypothetical protein
VIETDSSEVIPGKICPTCSRLPAMASGSPVRRSEISLSSSLVL